MGLFDLFRRKAATGGAWPLPITGGAIPFSWDTLWWQRGRNPINGGGETAIVGAATDVVVVADASVTPVDALTLGAEFVYMSEEFGYNVNASYAIDDNTTASAFFGTLYGDVDEDGIKDIHKDDAQWYVRLDWGVSF